VRSACSRDDVVGLIAPPKWQATSTTNALDVRIEKIEHALDESAIGWDRAVQEEVDRRRGK
jgi:hypothetical protein